MSYILVRKMITMPHSYAGRNWFFDFQAVPTVFVEKDVERSLQRAQNAANILAKSWSADLNTEWLTRHYLALKMIFSASLMLTTADYSHSKNIRLTDSYLQYYAVLSCMRALLYADFRTDWSSGGLVKATHNTVINKASNTISSFSKESGISAKSYAQELKALREIYSYGAPSSGPRLCDGYTTASLEKTTELCILICEIAQMHSEQLEQAIDTHYRGEFTLVDGDTHHCLAYSINDIEVFDDEDSYRLGYYYRKYPRPTNLLCMVSEGHVEDYFGAWCADSEDETEDVYNPDTNWRIIFPFP